MLLKQSLISKILLRSMLAARHFFTTFFLQKIAVYVHLWTQYKGINVSNTNQIVIVISDNLD